MIRKRRRRKLDDNVEVVLPITPMLDMSFQLLAFFILTFTPPSAAEGQLDMLLPATGVAKASAEEADPFAMSDKVPEPEAEITVAITSNAGNIASLVIREKEKTTPVADLATLRTELDKIRKQLGSDYPATIKLEADGNLKYAGLVEVMDTCLLAGFKSVGFGAPLGPRPEIEEKK
ncbi:MAG: ExbD/TolR family protein [Gemmataceae bacterium]